MAKTQILHVAVDKQTEKLLRQLAKAERESLSVILRRAIFSYLEKETSSQAQAAD